MATIEMPLEPPEPERAQDVFASASASEPSPPPPLPASGPDYGAADYIRLPEFGIRHYSLPDAALLAALDMWASDEVEGVPADGWYDEDDEHHGDQDDVLIRKALEPKRAQLFGALVRAAEVGQLPVEVRGREFANSRLIPERTFVLLDDLKDWLEVHGHNEGSIVEDIEESLMDDPWRIAAKVAEDRARLRLAVPTGARPGRTARTAPEVERMERELEANRLHLAHLEQQLHEARSGTGGEKRAMTTRQKRTLLTIIASVCHKARIDLKSRGAAVAIASATADIGAPVGEDSIRALLAEIPDAIDSRSR